MFGFSTWSGLKRGGISGTTKRENRLLPFVTNGQNKDFSPRLPGLQRQQWRTCLFCRTNASHAANTRIHELPLCDWHGIGRGSLYGTVRGSVFSRDASNTTWSGKGDSCQFNQADPRNAPRRAISCSDSFQVHTLSRYRLGRIDSTYTWFVGLLVGQPS